jgi:hypothetical protein
MACPRTVEREPHRDESLLTEGSTIESSTPSEVDRLDSVGVISRNREGVRQLMANPIANLESIPRREIVNLTLERPFISFTTPPSGSRAVVRPVSALTGASGYLE